MPSRAALSIIAALALALAGAVLWGAWETKRADGWQAYAKRLEAASAANLAATNAMRERERQEYERKASDAQALHSAALDRVRAATDDFIRAGRVQQDRSHSTTPANSAPDATGVRPYMPTDSIMVRTSDVQACGEWVAYGSALREWALEVSSDP